MVLPINEEVVQEQVHYIVVVFTFSQLLYSLLYNTINHALYFVTST